MFDPVPYGSRTTTDPQASWEATQQYAPLYSREASQQAPVQTSFPPPPPPSEPPFVPPPAGPQRYSPQPSGPHSYTPSPTGPQQYAPSSTGPQPSTSHFTGPQPSASHFTGQQYAPEAPPQPFRLPDDVAPAPAPAYVPAGTETTIRVSGTMGQMGQTGPTGPMGAAGTMAPEHQAPPEQHGQRHAAPQQEHDPYKPFVTAGQISGPKTPPPERQQELWNTVFGDNYEAMGEEPEDTGGGRRAWLLALITSVAVALVAALVWAFLAGPLRSSAAEGGASTQGSGESTPKASAPGKQATAKPQSIGRLPKYTGEASPRAGILTDKASAISVARLGGPWRLDLRSQHVQATYGFATRQYVAAGTDSAGTPQFAQVMTGPLSRSLAAKYSPASPEDLTPVISSVAFAARNKFFPEGNKVAKTAEQRLAVGGRPARVVAYQILAGGAKTTLVVGAVSTGADLPVIVYMSVPDSKKELLPDINTVFSSIRPTTTS
ncbi:hypothetical protein AB0B89_16445 [Sphaerisporangium sp. NPDC049002]|uniref:hypothetical protein n=1 Tax=Sphaerisporangium sp. NPDC049002 TaxID=3155392 RepID=UPI00340E5925